MLRVISADVFDVVGGRPVWRCCSDAISLGIRPIGAADRTELGNRMHRQ